MSCLCWVLQTSLALGLGGHWGWGGIDDGGVVFLAIIARLDAAVGDFMSFAF